MNPAARYTLIVLTLINLFNYLDRYVVSALVETLKKSELQLTDLQVGMLVPGFMLVYMLASPVFGVLGDRGSRPRLIALGVAIWSAATAMGGLAGSFVSLLGARAAVGIGEAAYGTIAPAVIADSFPVKLRGRVFAVFFSAIPIGSALGFVLGGLVNQAYGWRAAFYVAGLPGLALALLTLKLKDPPRGGEDEAGAVPKDAAPPGFKQYWELRKNKMYAGTVLGNAAYTFGLGGLAFWMPAFLERTRGIPQADASIHFGAVVVVTGFVGTFVGGWLGDRMLKKDPQAYLHLSGLATLIAAPFVAIALMSPDPTILWGGIVIAELLLFASTGPINSAILGFVNPARRAMAGAACNFTIHLLGDVPSPPLIGWISDRSSLGTAVLMVPVSIAISGIIWLLCARAGRREAARS